MIRRLFVWAVPDIALRWHSWRPNELWYWSIDEIAALGAVLNRRHSCTACDMEKR